MAYWKVNTTFKLLKSDGDSKFELFDFEIARTIIGMMLQLTILLFHDTWKLQNFFLVVVPLVFNSINFFRFPYWRLKKKQSIPACIM